MMKSSKLKKISSKEAQSLKRQVQRPVDARLGALTLELLLSFDLWILSLATARFETGALNLANRPDIQ